MDVRSGATVWNAHTRIENIPCMEVIGAIPPGASVEIFIEYYTPDIRVAPEPHFLPEAL
jgi:hypothetical protein